MNVKWDRPNPPERELPSPPSPWIYVVLLVVLLLAGAVLTVINWPKAQPTMTKEFFGCIFLLPTLVWFFIGGFIYHTSYELNHLGAVSWNIQRWYYLMNRQRWARQTLAILASAAVTPEIDVAERMLGLEGSKPMNPDKTMVLPDLGTAVGESRLQKVLESLLTPMIGMISTATSKGTFDILVQSLKIEDGADLHRVWSKLKLPGTPKLHWSAHDSAFPAGDWIDSQQMPDFRLVVAWQLRDAGQEPTFSEAATALLLARPEALTLRKGKLKTQAYLYRPIVAEADAIDAGLKNLLTREQVPTARIKHFWLSRLNRMTRHASKEAIKDGGLSAVEHDLDHAIGKPGPVNAWLLQALAAEMVQHGQGAQLIAAPLGNGVSFNLVGSAPAQISVPYDERLTYTVVSVPMTLGIIALAMLAMVALTSAPDDTTRLIIGIVAVLLIAATIGGDYMLRRNTEQDFWGRHG
jgi:hypothetical protein